MAVECKTWSLPDDKRFTGLCPMPVRAETEANTTTCQVCVIPVAVAASGGS